MQLKSVVFTVLVHCRFCTAILIKDVSAQEQLTIFA